MTAAPTPNHGLSASTAVNSGIPYELFLDCVHCGLCTAACPTYLETGNENDSPRGRIYLMRGVTDGRIELNEQVRRHLELCLDCRSCETACPSGVQYGRLIEPFRIAMERTPQRADDAAVRRASAVGESKTHDWFHRFILFGMFPHSTRVRLALAPARLAQVLGLDALLAKLGVFKLLPSRLKQLHDMLPRFHYFSPRLPEFLPAQGKRRARVALFTGCVGDVIFRDTNWATARVLQANGCDVVVPRGQVCCGAIHYHSGNEGPALEFMARNCATFDPSDVDAIIVNVAGCGSMLKDYGHTAAGSGFRVRGSGQKVIGDPVIGDRVISDHMIGNRVIGGRAEEASTSWTDHPITDPQSRIPNPESPIPNPRCAIPNPRSPSAFAAKVRDISEFLVELGPVAPTGALPIRATYHDACHLVHAQKIRAQPRKLLEMIPKLELVPLEESDICCGAAGTYNLTEPEMAERLAERKHRLIAATGAQAVFTANAGCLLQIGRKARQARLPLWIAHPVEALDLSYRKRPVPGKR